MARSISWSACSSKSFFSIICPATRCPGGRIRVYPEQSRKRRPRLVLLLRLQVCVSQHVIRFVDPRHPLQPRNRLERLRQQEITLPDQQRRFPKLRGVRIFSLSGLFESRDGLGVLLLLIEVQPALMLRSHSRACQPDQSDHEP